MNAGITDCEGSPWRVPADDNNPWRRRGEVALHLHYTCRLALVWFSFAANKIDEHLQTLQSAQFVEDSTYFCRRQEESKSICWVNPDPKQMQCWKALLLVKEEGMFYITKIVCITKEEEKEHNLNQTNKHSLPVGAKDFPAWSWKSV